MTSGKPNNISGTLITDQTSQLLENVIINKSRKENHERPNWTRNFRMMSEARTISLRNFLIEGMINQVVSYCLNKVISSIFELKAPEQRFDNEFSKKVFHFLRFKYYLITTLSGRRGVNIIIFFLLNLLTSLNGSCLFLENRVSTT